MRRSTWLLSSCLALILLGPIGPALTAANAGVVAPSRPIVWVSGQDSGQVFVTQGTTVLQTFDFVNGTPAGTPVIPGIGGPTPGIAVASPKPHLIEFSPDGRFAYVSFQNTNPGRVAVIDTTTRTVQTVITIPSNAPSTVPTRVTQAKSSPDGTFLIVTEVGFVTPTPAPGVLTRVNVDEAARSWTIGTQALVPAIGGKAVGPACTSFKPDSSVAYVDSSLSQFLGVMKVDPNTLAATPLFATDGDPQCGIHNPIPNPIGPNGPPTIVVTDNGAPTTPRLGHIHLINADTGAVTEPPPSPVTAANLHDNWPVGLQPVDAPTSDAANTSYESDRDLSTLHQSLLGTSTDNVLPIVDPNVPAPNVGVFEPRGAPDTLDGSGDTVFVAMKEAGDLGIIDNFSTQTYLHLVNPDPSCSTVGNANFHKCFVVHAVTVQPTHSALTCRPGTSGGGGALDVCTVTDVNGIRSVQVKNSASGTQQATFSFSCATAPTSFNFSVPAGTKYKVFVSDCQKPTVKQTFGLRANGGVNVGTA